MFCYSLILLVYGLLFLMSTCSIWKNLSKSEEKGSKSGCILVLNASFALIPIVLGFLIVATTMIV